MDQEISTQFWLSFKELKKEIEAKPEDDDTIKKVDYLVSTVGAFGWEYGPWGKDNYYLSISPNLDDSLLQGADFLIDHAPKIEGWKFISGKPKKEEIIKNFKIEDNSKTLVDINTESWKCVVYKFPDGTYDLDVITELQIDLDTQYAALELHLIGLLGERKYMNSIQHINIVDEFDKDYQSKAVQVNNIDRYIA